MPLKNNRLEEVSVSVQPEGEVRLTFFDPAYCRSDLIILDPSDRSLHAVLHESAHFIGHVGRDILPHMLQKQNVMLAAPHYSGGTLSLTTKLSVAK
mgnify:CR=1 FL=1